MFVRYCLLFHGCVVVFCLFRCFVSLVRSFVRHLCIGSLFISFLLSFSRYSFIYVISLYLFSVCLYCFIYVWVYLFCCLFISLVRALFLQFSLYCVISFLFYLLIYIVIYFVRSLFRYFFRSYFMYLFLFGRPSFLSFLFCSPLCLFCFIVLSLFLSAVSYLFVSVFLS